jgi:Flp pilus assembly protein TadG
MLRAALELTVLAAFITVLYLGAVAFSQLMQTGATPW